MDLYTIDKQTAWDAIFESKIIKSIENFCMKDAEQKYGTDMVEIMSFDFDTKKIQATMIHIPVYVLDYTFGGRNFDVFVNGYNQTVTGQRLYSFAKVALTTFGSLTAYFSLLSGIKYVLYPARLISFGILGVQVGVFFHFLPFIKSYYREYKKKIKAQGFEQMFNDSKRNNKNNYYQYNTYEEEEYHEDEQKTKKKEKKYERETSNNEKTKIDYYRILGLDPNQKRTYTSDDIRRAFLKKAKEHHPDKFTNPKEKENAHKIFTEVNRAYQVLKDTKKKAQYDATGSD